MTLCLVGGGLWAIFVHSGNITSNLTG